MRGMCGCARRARTSTAARRADFLVCGHLRHPPQLCLIAVPYYFKRRDPRTTCLVGCYIEKMMH